MNIFDFVNAAKALTTTEEVVALVDQFIAANTLVELVSLRQGLEELVGKPIISDDKTYLNLMGHTVLLAKDIPTIQIPDDKGLGNVQFPPRRMKSMNADFEGIMPGVDQMLYDQANAKALAQTEERVMAPAVATFDHNTNLPLAKKLLPVSNLADQSELDTPPPQHKYPFKLTGMHGDRGVICTVIPDDQMPLDKEGNRAEIVINDSPCFKLPETLTGPRSLWNSLSGKEAPEGFNVTIPALMEGDVYHRTHVTSDNRVLHIAHNSAGNQAIYVCTQNGNTIMREVIMKNYNLLKSNHETAAEKYANTLSYENPKNKG